MNILTAFVAGLIFGAGLLVAGMANPAKVLAFLDIAGSWDPSLAFVMIGAIGIGTPAFFIAKRKSVSFLGEKMQLPTSQMIDARLIGGSVLFGIGWGIAGICPGPALVLLGVGVTKCIIFVLAMIAGMLIFQGLEKLKAAA